MGTPVHTGNAWRGAVGAGGGGGQEIHSFIKFPQNNDSRGVDLPLPLSLPPLRDSGGFLFETAATGLAEPRAPQSPRSSRGDKSGNLNVNANTNGWSESREQADRQAAAGAGSP